MGLLALILSVCALCCSVWLYLDRRNYVSSDSVGGRLQQASEELSKTYARSLREIETEWADMYQKFSRLVGRVDKTRALESPPAVTAEPEKPGTRNDILRRHRGGMA